MQSLQRLKGLVQAAIASTDASMKASLNVRTAEAKVGFILRQSRQARAAQDEVEVSCVVRGGFVCRLLSAAQALWVILHDATGLMPTKSLARCWCVEMVCLEIKEFLLGLEASNQKVILQFKIFCFGFVCIFWGGRGRSEKFAYPQ